MHRILRKHSLAAAAAASLSAASSLSFGHSTASTEALPTLSDELKYLRSIEKEMRERWIKDEENWRKLPSRVWPVYHPPTSELPTLEENVKSLCRSNTSEPTKECLTNRFDLATLLVFNTIDPEAGFKMYESLAAEGYVDGIVATGVCLVEGFGVNQDYARGVSYLQKASELGHPQADFELAVLYFTGAAAPALPGSEPLAFEYFERAMDKGNFSYATYMVADLLLDSNDPSQYGRGLRLMYEAAEKGHRYARQEVLSFVSGRHKLVQASTASVEDN
ncbi:hypothetical protein AeMF1_021427 [Aphanomyces euteiches]|nr:hypothetical protein AeMF1_021427 [Aphanomyces euteiches]